MANTHYSISDLAKKSGVSIRTLRYYDQIGLLTPKRKDNGYRCYGQEEVHRLQHIMLLRACDLPLADIAQSLASDDFDLSAKLRAHLADLQHQMNSVAQAIHITQKTIEEMEDFEAMNDDEKFEKLKADAIAANEKEYGKEARSRYGDAAVDEANDNLRAMDKQTWDEKEALEQRIKDKLAAAMTTGDPTSPESQEVARMHAQWITAHWGAKNYSPEAHRGLVEGYLLDPRFIAYYDNACGEGATEFLRDIVLANISAS